MLTFTFLGVHTTWGQTNLALTAKVATSHVSPWEQLSAVNDGYVPTSSTDKGPGAYGNWNGAENYNTWNWVEYSFYSNNLIDSVRVYWWTDGGGIMPPTDAYIEYFENSQFVNAGNIGHELNKFNSLTVGKSSAKVRINMKSTTATGILELQVFGKAGAEVELIPYVQVNNQLQEQTNKANVVMGDNVSLSCELKGLSGGTYSWKGPKGFTSTDSVLVINSVAVKNIGSYKFRYSTANGFDFEKEFFVVTTIDISKVYSWPTYSPTLNYNFRQEYPDLEMPTKDRQDCNASNIGGQISSGWWTFIWGKKKKSVITEDAILPMLEKFNTDFAYIRDTMGWPPDRRAKEGYRSAIYLFGSGLCTDNADSTELGGWQGSIGGYPMVIASYYPVYCFDPSCPYNDKGFQTEAMIHEGIHAILADMPGCKDACWFQEGGNTWLQQEMASRRSGDHSSMGNLNGCTFLAPFMPIECYSGWLQDGSFGGPCAQGVNMFNGNQQICTWRTFLGGNQYGNAFPTFLGQVLGKGSIPWIWRYAKGLVLEGMADSLGEVQIRRLITEYRAKQALVDLGEWSGAVRKLLNSNFNLNVKSEWTPAWLNPPVWVATPYARTTLESDGTLIPEYRTTPGWSGANQIPLTAKGDSMAVEFKPIGKNMNCLLCYRDIFGKTIYSAPVDSGICALKLQSPPANDVVFAVITNTDYEYNGEETRKSHFDYRLKIDTALIVPAHTHKRWYAWDDNPQDDVPPALAAITRPDTLAPTDILLELKALLESQLTGSDIGTFTTVDPNSVNAPVYSLVAGDGDKDNASFKIKNNKLQLKKRLDYETSPNYTIRVRSTNMVGKYVEKPFVVTVGNVVETSVPEGLENSNAVLVYPNPVDQRATVQLGSGEDIQSIEIIGLTGSTVKMIENINAREYTIDKGNLANGLYYLKVNSSGNYIVKVLFQ